ncbi:hypothetical protein, partial [Streptomyces sp. NPDC005568]|uniref:hypothetical protein n=1 Tax=Streptomyces sp. NPDC005568 TaxID=3156887 RepID=UPI0033B74974
VRYLPTPLDVEAIEGHDVTQIAGTSNIHDWVEFDVLNGDFEAMKLAVIACLQQAGVTIKEESFSSPGEKHVRLDLTNVSVFDK